MSDPANLQTLLSRFEDVSLIGRGAFAHVYKGRDPQRDQVVAIKVLLKEANEANLRRFQREADAMQAISSPHLVGLYEVGLDAQPPFLLMEWMGGGTLASLHPPKTPADPAQARRAARALLEGLDLVHRKGMMHRDIKPTNVLVREDGSVALADLGMVGTETASTITGTGAILGTPRYMPPEVLLGKRWSPASDLFALGLTLWDFTVGQHPAAHFGWSLTMFLNPSLELPRMEDVGAYRNPSLERLMAALLRYEPGDRPADASEALAILGPEAAAAAGDAEAIAAYVPGLHGPDPGEEDDDDSMATWAGENDATLGGDTSARSPDQSKLRTQRRGPGQTTRRAGVDALSQRPAGAAVPATPLRRGSVAAAPPPSPSTTPMWIAASVLLLLLSAAGLWSLRPSPDPGLDPLPTEDAEAPLPPGFQPDLPRRRYLDGGRVELRWATPVKAYAMGTLRSHDSILEVPRGRSEVDPAVVLEPPDPDTPHRALSFLLVDRTGQRVDAGIPEGFEVPSLQAATQALLATCAKGPPEDVAEAFAPLAEVFASGSLGRDLDPRTERKLYQALAPFEAAVDEVAGACKQRLELEAVAAPPDGPYDLLDLPAGVLPPRASGEVLRVALEVSAVQAAALARMRLGPQLTLRLPTPDSGWYLFTLPSTWTSQAHVEYALTLEPASASLGEARLIRGTAP